MTAAGRVPLVEVPVAVLDESWIGEQVLITHELTCDGGRPCPSHFGGLSDLEPGPPVLRPDLDWSVLPSLFVFIGGELLLVTARDVVVAAPSPTALDVTEEDLTAGDALAADLQDGARDITSSPYDT